MGVGMSAVGWVWGGILSKVAQISLHYWSPTLPGVLKTKGADGFIHAVC